MHKDLRHRDKINDIYWTKWIIHNQQRMHPLSDTCEWEKQT